MKELVTDSKEYRELIACRMVFCEGCSNWKPYTEGVSAGTFGRCMLFDISTDFNFYCQAGIRKEES